MNQSGLQSGWVKSLLTVAILFAIQLACIQSAGAQSTNGSVAEVIKLETGKALQREIAGEQEHQYGIELIEGQCAEVLVEQRGVDVVVQTLGADGKLIVEFDNESRTDGQERIEIVAVASGNYRLVVKAKYPRLANGHYQIGLGQLRSATENDRGLDEARRLRATAWQLRFAGKFAEALPLAEKALALQERFLGSENSELAYTLHLLGVITRFTFDYARSEGLHLRGLRIAEKTLGPNHPIVAKLLFSLGSCYAESGDYVRGASSYQDAIQVEEKALGPDHPEVAYILTSLAFLYMSMDDLVRPEALLQRALTISQKAFGEDHVEVARELNYLGMFYDGKGDYASAEPLLQRSLASWEKMFGPGSGWVSIGLHNLADLYSDMGNYQKAEPLYLRVLSLDEKNNGADHPTVVRERAALALLYYYEGNYAKSEAMYLEALPALEKLQGPNHPTVAFYLRKFADLYVATHEYSKAQALYRRSLSIMESYCGARCLSMAEILVGLARISVAQGEIAEAVDFQSHAHAITEHDIDVTLATGSERQKLAYLSNLREQMDQAVSLHTRFAADNARARDLAAIAILQRKGRLQDALSQELVSIRSRMNTEDAALLDQLNASTSKLARLVLGGPQEESPQEYQGRVKSLEAQREKLQAEVSQRSAEFQAREQPVNLTTIRAALPAQTALVEFAVYRPFDPDTNGARDDGEPRYVAYVIRSHGDVGWADLGPAKDLDAGIDKWRGSLREPQRQDVQQLARTLDEKIMQPIRTLLGDAKLLLISPDGELNLIPFGALVDRQGHYLIENFSVTYLTSGRDLLRMQVARESKSKPLVIADPAFGEMGSQNLAVNQIQKSHRLDEKRRSITSGASLDEVYFAPLEGSEIEARAIQKLFPEARLMTGPQATEDAVKQANAPRLLHLATHGFFLSEPRAGASAANRVSTPIENPLLRSGLALTGANLRNGRSNDGILTALEASGLNLWGTKLVVLSACDTGVGEVHNGEGVYGLRRAFVLAGAESLVMSLWPISDYTTRQLMTGYYQNLQHGLGRGEALRQVQLAMLKKNPKLHPFYWANFIQAGEWANLEGRR